MCDERNEANEQEQQAEQKQKETRDRASRIKNEPTQLHDAVLPLQQITVKHNLNVEYKNVIKSLFTCLLTYQNLHYDT